MREPEKRLAAEEETDSRLEARTQQVQMQKLKTSLESEDSIALWKEPARCRRKAAFSIDLNASDIDALPLNS